MNIVITGPMGSGKSSTGKLAAEKLSMEFIDTDAAIEREEGRTVSEIFSNDGETAFRELERKLVMDLAGKDNMLIATGGGVVLSAENMRRLRMNGIIINFNAPADVILERIESSGRPLLGTGDELHKYLDARKDSYSVCDHRIETGNMSIEEVADCVCHIASLPVVRVCACISGADAMSDVQYAAMNGATMVELRLDLMPSPDIEALVRESPVPVIATDRANAKNLERAIAAGCDFVDVDMDCPERDAIIELAAGSGCKSIVSLHNFIGVPDALPDKGSANFLKVAATLNSTEALKRLVALHDKREDVIIAAMGPLGGLLRVFGPMLGSYLTYCSVGEATATGQLDLQTMNDIYRGMRIR
jgi:shikimate kinase